MSTTRATNLGGLALLLWAATPASGQAAPTWTLSVEQRIGAPGQSDVELTAVGPVLVDPAGALYVAQPADHLIRKIDSAGHQVAEIGRRGQGPGEFNTSSIAMTWKADTLMALDGNIGPPRLVAFSRSGVPADTRALPPVPPPEPFNTPNSSMAVMSNGLVLVRARDERLGTTGVPIPPIPLLLADQSGRPTRTIAALSAPFGYVHFPRGIRGVPVSGKPAALSALSDDELVAIAPDGSGLIIVNRHAARTGEPATFSVFRLSAAGDTTWTRRVDYGYPPVGVSQATRDSLAAFVVQSYATAVDPATARPVAAAILASAPTNYSPVTAALVDADQRIWLALRGSNEPMARWLVLDPKGATLGAVLLPRAAQVVTGQGAKVWVLDKDQDDVSILTRYRIGR